MTEFMKVYPQYTKLIIFKARDRYMTSFKGDYSYLEQADYFIKKRVIVDGETTIRRTLLQYCEEVMLVEQVTTSNINLNDNNNYDVL